MATSGRIVLTHTVSRRARSNSRSTRRQIPASSGGTSAGAAQAQSDCRKSGEGCPPRCAPASGPVKLGRAAVDAPGGGACLCQLQARLDSPAAGRLETKGHLQPGAREHPAEHRACEEAQGPRGVGGRPRDASPARPLPRRARRGTTGSPLPQRAGSSRRAQRLALGCSMSSSARRKVTTVRPVRALAALAVGARDRE